MRRYTPGPWTSTPPVPGVPFTIHTARTEPHEAPLAVTFSRSDSAVEHANALLMAAAPALLEALGHAVAAYRRLDPLGDPLWLRDAYAAMAKAEASHG